MKRGDVFWSSLRAKEINAPLITNSKWLNHESLRIPLWEVIYLLKTFLYSEICFKTLHLSYTWVQFLMFCFGSQFTESLFVSRGTNAWGPKPEVRRKWHNHVFICLFIKRPVHSPLIVQVWSVLNRDSVQTQSVALWFCLCGKMCVWPLDTG